MQSTDQQALRHPEPPPPVFAHRPVGRPPACVENCQEQLKHFRSSSFPKIEAHGILLLHVFSVISVRKVSVHVCTVGVCMHVCVCVSVCVCARVGGTKGLSSFDLFALLMGDCDSKLVSS